MEGGGPLAVFFFVQFAVGPPPPVETLKSLNWVILAAAPRANRSKLVCSHSKLEANSVKLSA